MAPSRSYGDPGKKQKISGKEIFNKLLSGLLRCSARLGLLNAGLAIARVRVIFLSTALRTFFRKYFWFCWHCSTIDSTNAPAPAKSLLNVRNGQEFPDPRQPTIDDFQSYIWKNKSEKFKLFFRGSLSPLRIMQKTFSDGQGVVFF